MAPQRQDQQEAQQQNADLSRPRFNNAHLRVREPAAPSEPQVYEISFFNWDIADPVGQQLEQPATMDAPISVDEEFDYSKAFFEEFGEVEEPPRRQRKRVYTADSRHNPALHFPKKRRSKRARTRTTCPRAYRRRTNTGATVIGTSSSADSGPSTYTVVEPSSTITPLAPLSGTTLEDGMCPSPLRDKGKGKAREDDPESDTDADSIGFSGGPSEEYDPRLTARALAAVEAAGFLSEASIPSRSSTSDSDEHVIHSGPSAPLEPYDTSLTARALAAVSAAGFLSGISIPSSSSASNSDEQSIYRDPSTPLERYDTSLTARALAAVSAAGFLSGIPIPSSSSASNSDEQNMCSGSSTLSGPYDTSLTARAFAAVSAAGFLSEFSISITPSSLASVSQGDEEYDSVCESDDRRG